MRCARVLLFSTLLAGCDLFGSGRSVDDEVKDVQVEFRSLFSVPAHVKPELKQAGGDDVYDVTVKFDRMPPGFTQDEVRKNANIVVRKHVRKVRDVNVVF